MWVMPKRLSDALASTAPRTMLTTVDILSPGSNQPIVLGCQVISGSIKVDATSAIRRSLSNCVLDTSQAPANKLLPLVATLPPSPYGFECQVNQGLRYPDGTSDLIPIGVFEIEQADQTAPGTLTISGKDRGFRMQAPLGFTLNLFAGQNYVDAAVQILAAAFPGSQTFPPYPINAQRDSFSTPTLVYSTGDSPWDDAIALMASIGYQVFMDQAGTIIFRAVPDSGSVSPVWSYIAGSTAVFNQAVRSQLQTDGQFKAASHAIVLGITIDGSSPIRSDAFDLDPKSPTYWNGIFGDHAVILNSQYITSQAQADQAAAALLAANQGAIEKVSFKAAPHPGLQADDVIAVYSPQSGTNSFYSVETMDLPLVAGEMTVTARGRRGGGTAVVSIPVGGGGGGGGGGSIPTPPGIPIITSVTGSDSAIAVTWTAPSAGGDPGGLGQYSVIATPQAPPGTIGAIRGPTFAGTGAGTGTSVTLTKPPGTVAGDFEFVWIAVPQANTTTPMAGFTPLPATQGLGGAPSTQGWWRRCDGTGGDTPPPSTISGAATRIQGICFSYPGVDAVQPFDVAPTNSGTNVFGGLTLTAPSITTVNANDQDVFIGVLTWPAGSGTIPAMTPPNGFTQQGAQTSTSNATSPNLSMIVADTPDPLAGATGTVSAGFGNTAGSQSGGTLLMALKSSGTGGGGGAQVVVTASGTATSATITPCQNGQAYTVTVVATNSKGSTLSVPSAQVTPNSVVTAQLPSAPTNVGAQPTGVSGQIKVSWTLSNNNGSTITSYVVTPYIANVAQATQTQANPALSSLTLTGLTDGTLYQFTVHATSTGPAGSSPESSPKTTATTPGGLTAPGPPTNVVAIVRADGNVQITATAPVNTGSSPLAANNSWTLTSSPGGFVNLAGLGLWVYTTGVTLVAGTSYTFTATVKNTDGLTSVASAPSNAVIAGGSGPPGPPTNVSLASNGTTGQLVATWANPAATGGSTLTSYSITPFIGTNPGTPQVFAGGPLTTATLTGLVNGTTYTIKITVTNTGGFTSSQSAASNTAKPTAAAAAPSAPTNPAAAANGLSGQIAVTWTPSVDNGSVISGYTATSSPGGLTATVSGAVATTVTVTGLTNGTPYTFTVKANSNLGQSVASAPSNSATPGTTATAADPPTALTATVTGSGAVNIGFTPPVNKGGVGQSIASYKATAVPALGPLCAGLMDDQTIPIETGGNGNYRDVILGQVICVKWANLQTSQNGALLTSADTCDADGVSLGISLATAVANLKALGSQYFIKFRVLCGRYAPAWAMNLPDQGNNNPLGGKTGSPFPMTDVAAAITANCGRWWSNEFAVAFADMHTKLAAIYDIDPAVREVCVTMCGAIYQESFVRGNTNVNFAALNGAGWDQTKDLAAIQNSIDIVAAAWNLTRFSIASNPYNIVTSTTSTQSGSTTTGILGVSRNKYGVQFLPENNSLRDPIQTGEYAVLYNWMAANPPIGGQTAKVASIGSLTNTVQTAINQGWSHLELHHADYSNAGVPAGYMTSVALGPVATSLATKAVDTPTVASSGASPVPLSGLNTTFPYSVTVTDVNTPAGLTSVPSSAVVFTPIVNSLPDPPTNLNAAGTGVSGEIVLSWNPPGNTGGSPINFYTITPKIVGGATLATVRQNNGGASSINIGGLTNGTLYTFTMTTTNNLGAVSIASAISQPSTGATPSTGASAPSPPTAQTSAANGVGGQIVVSWIPGPNNGSNVTGFTVGTYIAAVLQNTTAVNGSGTTSKTISGLLTDGTTYQFKINAESNLGPSTLSGFTTPAIAPATGIGNPSGRSLKLGLDCQTGGASLPTPGDAANFDVISYKTTWPIPSGTGAAIDAAWAANNQVELYNYQNAEHMKPAEISATNPPQSWYAHNAAGQTGATGTGNVLANPRDPGYTAFKVSQARSSMAQSPHVTGIFWDQSGTDSLTNIPGFSAVIPGTSTAYTSSPTNENKWFVDVKNGVTVPSFNALAGGKKMICNGLGHQGNFFDPLLGGLNILGAPGSPPFGGMMESWDCGGSYPTLPNAAGAANAIAIIEAVYAHGGDFIWANVNGQAPNANRLQYCKAGVAICLLATAGYQTMCFRYHETLSDRAAIPYGKVSIGEPAGAKNISGAVWSRVFQGGLVLYAPSDKGGSFTLVGGKYTDTAQDGTSTGAILSGTINVPANGAFLLFGPHA